jgi:hypothetical protein
MAIAVPALSAASRARTEGIPAVSVLPELGR